MGTLVPGEGCIQWKLGKLQRRCGWCKFFQFLLIYLESVLTRKFLLSSSDHVPFFCLMDNKLSYLVAAQTNKDKTFLHTIFSAHVHSAAEPWNRWCDVTVAWFLDLNCWRHLWCILVCILVSVFCIRFWRPFLVVMIALNHIVGICCHMPHTFS